VRLYNCLGKNLDKLRSKKKHLKRFDLAAMLRYKTAAKRVEPWLEAFWEPEAVIVYAKLWGEQGRVH